MGHRKTHKSLIFAHRGASLEAAENTRAAFDKALHYSIDGIETDVQLTRDEICVLWHDRHTDKLNRSGMRIDDFDYSQLEKMDFTAHFDQITQKEGVISLKEFISTYRGRCQLQIEIKNRDWEPVSRHHIKIKQTMNLLGAAMDRDVFMSSFNLQSMGFAHQNNPNIPLFYAIDEHQHWSVIKRILTDHSYLAGLCLSIEMLDHCLVDLIRDHEKKILTYTCNSDRHINKALRLGVDVLITDDPQKAITMRESCNAMFPV